MRIGQILKEQQPEEYRKFNKKRKQSRRGSSKEHLSFSDFENMMKHDSYYRGKGGAIKQRE